MARSTKAAAPTATSTLVRRPAVRWRYCRSAPMIVPNTKAVPRLTSVSKKSAVWKVVRNFIACPGKHDLESGHRSSEEICCCTGGLLQFQQAAVTLFVSKGEPRALGVPGEGRNGRTVVATN